MDTYIIFYKTYITARSIFIKSKKLPDEQDIMTFLYRQNKKHGIRGRGNGIHSIRVVKVEKGPEKKTSN